MSNRDKRAGIARETLTILEKGHYANSKGERVQLSDAIRHAVSKSELYTPERLAEMSGAGKKAQNTDTVFEVSNETTLAAAFRIQKCYGKVLSLNFASAKNPGGGFLGGSQAQEESLARASALFPAIAQMDTYYSVNRTCGTCLYTDHMIYSPDVPVFRDDNDQLLDEHWLTSVITVPAVNFGALKEAEKPDAEPKMRQRINYVLQVASEKGYENLVLGAWGCGVFRNSPEKVASYFIDVFTSDSVYKNVFRRVVFAILDLSKELGCITPFKECFGNPDHVELKTVDD